MYLKPASVVNRVYLSLSIYSFRLVRLHFYSVTAQDRRKGRPGVLFPSSRWPAAQHPGPCHGGLQRAWARPRCSPAPSRTAANCLWPAPADAEIKHVGRAGSSQSHTLRDAGQSTQQH